MDVRVELWRRLSTEELMRLNCGVGEDSWESLGLQGDPTSPFWRRSTLGFLWRDDAKAETPVLWPPHEKSWLIGKNPDAGSDWGQEEKRTTEDDMVGWHHQTWWKWVWVNSGNCWVRHDRDWTITILWNIFLVLMCIFLLQVWNFLCIRLFHLHTETFYIFLSNLNIFYLFIVLKSWGHVKSGHLCLIPEFRGKTFSFSLSSMMLVKCLS